MGQNIDIELLRIINLNRNIALDPTFNVITHSASPISISIPVGVLTYAFLKKDSTIKQKGVRLALGISSAALITSLVKVTVQRSRPFVTYPEIDNQTDAGSYSFPSGHTSNAFATATALSLNFRKWYVVIPSYTWAAAVGYSRMHLGVHYPSDVLAGALVGTGCAYMSFKIQKWLQTKSAKRKAIRSR